MSGLFARSVKNARLTGFVKRGWRGFPVVRSVGLRLWIIAKRLWVVGGIFLSRLPDLFSSF